MKTLLKVLFAVACCVPLLLLVGSMPIYLDLLGVPTVFAAAGTPAGYTLIELWVNGVLAANWGQIVRDLLGTVVALLAFVLAVWGLVVVLDPNRPKGQAES